MHLNTRYSLKGVASIMLGIKNIIFETTLTKAQPCTSLVQLPYSAKF